VERLKLVERLELVVMNKQLVQEFIDERSQTWEQLERLVQPNIKRPHYLSEDEIRWVTRAYRTVSADFATASRQYPQHPVNARLVALLTMTRTITGAREPRTHQFIRFITHDYWRLVAGRPMLLSAAGFFLLAPTILMMMWALKDPARVASFLPFDVTQARTSYQDAGESAGEQSAMASFILTNNIRVSFLAFAAGITAGIGTGYLLISNGILIGALIGVMTHRGYGSVVFALIMPHGVLELSIIVVAAAAGLRIGWAIVNPGYRPRTQALVQEALNGVLIVVGTIPWFVLAGVVEGFITPAGFGPTVAGVIGIGLGVLYWALVVWRGWGGRETASYRPRFTRK
jgi:uncharacterized membrane protein SpoIIM required for sporulation